MTQGFTQALSIPLAPNKGGTGLVTPGTTGNLLTSNGTAWVSQAPAATTSFVVKQVRFTTGTANSGTTIMPYDNTIPQNTEGTQFMSLAITPASTANILVIESLVNCSPSAAGTVVVAAIFQDSVASAISSGWSYQATATGMNQIMIVATMTAGTTSATTFKVRAGGHIAGTLTFNGQVSSPFLGGSLLSNIIITEYTS